MECLYKNICTYYLSHCNEDSCWRAKYVNGMVTEEFKELLREGKLEELLNKNHDN